MSGSRKLADADVELLRAAWADGSTAADLAAEFEVSERHVRRLVRGDQRATVTHVDALQDGGTLPAVDRFLADLDLDAAVDPLAAIARAVAGRVDAAAASDTSAALTALPRLASELTDVLDRIRAVDAARRPPDVIDEIRARREARLLALAVERRRRPKTHRPV